MTARPSFTYELPNRHFVKVTLSDGESTIYLYPSFLIDPLALLIGAIISLLKGVEEMHFDWYDEPGTWRWKLRRTSEGLKINILRFDVSHAPPSDEKGELEFSGKFDLLRFAVLVRGALRQLLNEHSMKGYKELWSYDFPMSEYRKLDELIKEEKQR